MSNTMQIPAHEHGVLRLFAIDLPADGIAAFARETNDTEETMDWPLRDALGAQSLDPDCIEVIALADLADYGLAKYLIEGNGIPAAQVDPMHSQLAALTGHALLISSGAFQGAPQRLSLKAPLRHIATFFEETPPVVFEDLPDDSAKRTAPDVAPLRKKPSDAAIGGRVAMVALLVAFGVAGLMVWMAG